ncbi:rootletin-like [Hirundo rustica]|uniref:rootletin-like n=1 Tax=Hirundo rustica TaxID=43150 RepID=UPI001A942F17|nr:rootletin-like [Hirundo rustica]
MAEPSKTLITTAAVLLSENVIEWAFSRYRRRKNEKTKKDMECKMDIDFQELKKKMEALHESFTELQDTKQSELEGLRTHLENNKGNKVEEIVWSVKSRLKKYLRQFSHGIRTLEENIEDWSETTEYELQRLRAELQKNKGNKVEEIVWSVKSRLKKYLRQFSHGIRTLEENIEDWSETTEYELQRLRAELQKNKEEVEIVWSLKSRLKKYLRQLSHGIQSLKENVEDLSETIEYELQCLRPELEKNKGKKEDESSNFCMETKVPQLSYRIQTLDPELQERWEFPNHELQFVTAGLENSQD